ncbi:hypothetical protein [Shewanella sp. TC10]
MLNASSTHIRYVIGGLNRAEYVQMSKES